MQWPRRLHRQIRDLTCNASGRVFTQSVNLKRHVCRADTKDLPYTCEICHKGFGSTDMLQRHKKSTAKEKFTSVQNVQKRFLERTTYYTTFKHSFEKGSGEAHQRDVHQIGAGLKRKTLSTTNSKTRQARNNNPSIVEPGVNEGASTSTSTIPLQANSAPSFPFRHILSYHHLIFLLQSTRIISGLFDITDITNLGQYLNYPISPI